jgi:ubiquinone/menaquinone biosynthesis C-methylase UbiE
LSAGGSERLVAAAALRAGDDVLDLAPGDGALTFAAHAQIGDGWVFAVDESVAVLEELLRRAHAANVAGVMYLVGGGDVIPLPDATADVCVAQSLRPVDGIAAELARVLRPGGRLSAGIPLAGEPDPRALAAALAAAGFEAVAVEPEQLDDASLAHITARRP